MLELMGLCDPDETGVGEGGGDLEPSDAVAMLELLGLGSPYGVEVGVEATEGTGCEGPTDGSRRVGGMEVGRSHGVEAATGVGEGGGDLESSDAVAMLDHLGRWCRERCCQQITCDEGYQTSQSDCLGVIIRVVGHDGEIRCESQARARQGG